MKHEYRVRLGCQFLASRRGSGGHKLAEVSAMDHMQAAVNEACAGVQAGDGGPFGAVVVRQGKIVATGHNM
ncbi:hypothetical protein OSTOST_22079, partial [Ostertagia ostertagi]